MGALARPGLVTAAVLVGLGGLGFAGCRPAAGTAARSVTEPERGASFEDLERELDRNAGALRRRGVAVRSVGTKDKAVSKSKVAEEVTTPADVADPDPDEAGAQAESLDDEAPRLTSVRRDKAKRPKCRRICDLAETACDLQAQICALAERHPDEPRYAAVCERASDQCEVAESACDRCE